MATSTPQSALSFPRETFARLSPHPYLLANLQPSITANTPPTRANGRLPNQFRTPHINNGSLTHAEGSAVVRIGDTTVVCGVRGEILAAKDVGGYRLDKVKASEKTGYNEAKELDLLVPNIELQTGCSPSFLPGQPPSTLAQSLSTRIYTLLHESRFVDGEDLRIWYTPPDMRDTDRMQEADEEDETQVPQAEVKAFWTLYIDMLFISLDGNAFDAAWAAVVSALRDVRLPKAYWDADREMILCDDAISSSKRLNLRGLPVATTALLFREKELGGVREKKQWLLVDPDAFEEGLCDEGVTVVVDKSEGKTQLMGITKNGGTVIDQKEIREVLQLGEERWNTMNQILKT